MTQEQIFEDLDPEGVLNKASDLKAQGYRLVQICGVTGTGETELIYSFDLDHRLVNQRVVVPHGMPVNSITPIYWSAFVYENEVHDLFGVEFKNSQLDYKGSFFRMSLTTPWRGPDAEAGRQGGGESRWARGQ